jgi:hypothetical protein
MPTGLEQSATQAISTDFIRQFLLWAAERVTRFACEDKMNQR